MKNTEMNESKFDEVSIRNEFNWFRDDLYDTFDDEFESPIENIDITALDTDKIDELVKDEDYMWYQDYLDKLSDDCKHEALDYVKNNYPEFLKDEEWNIVEPMKWWSVNKELAHDLDNKPAFDRNNVKAELTQNLIESYKNAA